MFDASNIILYRNENITNSTLSNYKSIDNTHIDNTVHGIKTFQYGMNLYQSGMISFQYDSKFMAEYENTCQKLYTGFTFGKNSFKI